MTDDSADPSTDQQPYMGPERRQWDRLERAPRVVGRARLRPEYAIRDPVFRAGQWYPVVELDYPQRGLLAPPPAGYILLNVNGRICREWAQHFEVMPGGPGEGRSGVGATITCGKRRSIERQASHRA